METKICYKPKNNNDLIEDFDKMAKDICIVNKQLKVVSITKDKFKPNILLIHKKVFYILITSSAIVS